MTKPRVTKKQLEAFRELRDRLRKWKDDFYDDECINCPLCQVNGLEEHDWGGASPTGCKKCICFIFATTEEKTINAESTGMDWDRICWTLWNRSEHIESVRAAYQKLKRRMQHAGIKVLT